MFILLYSYFIKNCYNEFIIIIEVLHKHYSISRFIYYTFFFLKLFLIIMIFSLIETRENKLTFYKIKNLYTKLKFVNIKKMT